MQEIVPGIHVESNYPPYNCALIESDEGAVVIDVPPQPNYAWAWRHQVEELVGKPHYLVITDASLDRQIAATLWDVPVIASVATLRAIAAYDERSWREAIHAFVTRYPGSGEELSRVRPHRPTLAFDTRFTLYCREPPLEFEVVEGAAVGSLWCIVPEHNLLFAGDTVVVDVPMPLESTPDSKAWLNTLGALARRSTVHKIVPGRGKAPILRLDIEPQRELLRVMRRTARTLAHNSSNGIRLTQSAQDLGQAFFNTQGQRAVRAIRVGLEHLVKEIHKAEATSGDDEGD